MFLTEWDLGRLAAGAHTKSYESLGAHPASLGGRTGTRFAVWAPGADAVSVIGSFNAWDWSRNPMRRRDPGGFWEAFVEGVGEGALYKYAVSSQHGRFRAEKADPYAFAAERPPRTASVVYDLSRFRWSDGKWMAGRATRNRHDAPISVYEVHLGSWMRSSGFNAGRPDYERLADRLAEYAASMGFTHVELLPVMEHPFGGSWGYQTTAYFAPTSRFGPPRHFMAFVDCLHRRGLGVILDWAPAHFPDDGHALARFDGTCLYEHADPRRGRHPHWGTLVFDHDRREVANFLTSSALFWLDKYHVDGIRVDAVASMLYLDYGRGDGEWLPNRHGGREDLGAVAFLKGLNEEVYREFPDVMMVAEESTAWPRVSGPTSGGGLGFGFKWNLGWMHDTLGYMRLDPVHRKHHQDKLTFSILYAFSENFVLPFSHDEVVHGKGSMLAKMPGDGWSRFASLRLLYAYMFAHPGKKLLFMGSEFGQPSEWSHQRGLDWHVAERPTHCGLQRLVRDLNRLYRSREALYVLDSDAGGFAWLDCEDYDSSVLSWLRTGREPSEIVAVVCNFTPVFREDYRVGLPLAGPWTEVLNTDSEYYSGSNLGNLGSVDAEQRPHRGQPCSATVTLPPLAALYLEPA